MQQLCCSSGASRGGGIGLKSLLYFNAGVILINAKLWREEHFYEKTVDYVRKNVKNIKCADQDTLNIMIDERKINLGREYNYCEQYWLNINDKIENPIIVHFVGANPNRFDCMHSMRHIWWKYARLSDFYEDFMMQNSYNIYKYMFKLKFDNIKFFIYSKVGSQKSRKRYYNKYLHNTKILNSLKY